MNNFNLKRLLTAAFVILLSASFVLSGCNGDSGEKTVCTVDYSNSSAIKITDNTCAELNKSPSDF